jgi:hypothetical protein
VRKGLARRSNSPVFPERYRRPSRGTLSSTLVPAPRFDSTRKLPPSTSARFLMDRSPTPHEGSCLAHRLGIPLLFEFPGLGHVERHAYQAVGGRAAVVQRARGRGSSASCPPDGSRGIPPRTPRSPPRPGAAFGRSFHDRRDGWSRNGPRGWVARRPVDRGGGCRWRRCRTPRSPGLVPRARGPRPLWRA